MAEMDAFERRLSAALLTYAHEMPARVDAAAVAERVADERSRPRWRPALPAVPRSAWLLVGAGLLALAGILAIGAGLFDRFWRPSSPLGITLVASTTLGPNDVAADRDGSVWILGPSGLTRFDPAGGPSRTWGPGDDLGFSATGIAAARDGGVWLVTSLTVRHFDGERLDEPLRLPAAAGAVVAVAEAPDGTPWAGTEGGVYRLLDGAWAAVPGQPPGFTASAISFGPDGNVWVSEALYPGPTASGIARFDGTTWTMYRQDTRAGLAIDGSGNVWTGGSTGLVRFDGAAWKATSPDELGAGGYWTLVAGRGGELWAVTSWAETAAPIRVARYDDGAWTAWGPESGLPTGETRGGSSAELAVTPAGAFVGVPGSLYRLVGDSWDLAWRDPSSPLAVRGIAPAAGVEAWAQTIGPEPRLLHLAAGGAAEDPLPDAAAAANAVVLAQDGTPLAATTAGLAARVDGRWTFVDREPALGVGMDPDGTAWVLGSGASLRRLQRSPEGWTAEDVPVAQGGWSAVAAYGIAPTIAVDGAGDIWANGGQWGYGRAPGLRRFDGTRWEAMRPDGVPGGAVFDNLAAAPDGSIWVTIDGTGTRDSCCAPPDPATRVARYDGTSWTVYGTADGLPADNFERSLAITPDGTVWLSTTAGLYRFDGGRWQVAIGDHRLGTIAAAPDGALWTSGEPGILRIADPPR